MKLTKLVSYLAIATWVLVGIYGIIFNISYIDEAKYLIKGWLMTTGQVGYYSTKGFFYQHMPGGWLWYGLGQKLFGPSLLVGRIQSFLVGLTNLWLSFALGKRLGGKKGGLATLAMMSLGPVIALYYSASVPQSILALVFLLGFIFLYDGTVKKNSRRLLLATICFSLLLVIRENFLFSLVLYFGFLSLMLKSITKLLPHLGVALITLGIFIVPGYPGTINVFKNFPGVSFLLPVSPAEQEVLSLYWKEGLQSLALHFRALREFGIIFHAWFISLAWLGYRWLRQKKIGLSFRTKAERKYWLFLVFLTGFNFLIHAFAAFKLSPRAIISYLSYISPLIAVILANLIVVEVKIKKASLVFLGLLILAPVGIRFSRIFAIPTRNPDLRLVTQSAEKLKPIINNKEKIIWISEPISLYLAGQVSHYPLINHINFYKPSQETEIVEALGFWNQTMLVNWFQGADLVVIGDNKLRLLRDSDQGKPLAELIDQQMQAKFKLVATRDDVWPGEMKFYLPK